MLRIPVIVSSDSGRNVSTIPAHREHSRYSAVDGRQSASNILIAARQAHGENGFFVVGSHSHLAPKRNLAHNIQSKAKAGPYIAAVVLPPGHV